ncbi:DUF5317 family protein [Clostridium sp. DL1XJH146]
MVETVLLALFIAKLKGYKLKPLFKDWAIYPPVIFTLLYVVMNITIFLGFYGFVKYARLLETLYVLTFLALIFKYSLYKSAFVGSICIFIGTALNKLAMAANGGKMPVFPTLSYLTGYAKPDSFDKVNDIHILGSSSTKVKFLTDYLDLGYSILSIGDVFIRLFTFIIIYSSIKYINIQKLK